jgi:putative ABC transport system ATP-binding protein
LYYLFCISEPTGSLDSRNELELMELLLRINQESRVTMVCVTHNPALECYADRILYFQDGQIVKQALNSEQVHLDYLSYMHYINKTHHVEE